MDFAMYVACKYVMQYVHVAAAHCNVRKRAGFQRKAPLQVLKISVSTTFDSIFAPLPHYPRYPNYGIRNFDILFQRLLDRIMKLQ